MEARVRTAAIALALLGAVGALWWWADHAKQRGRSDSAQTEVGGGRTGERLQGGAGGGGGTTPADASQGASTVTNTGNRAALPAGAGPAKLDRWTGLRTKVGAVDESPADARAVLIPFLRAQFVGQALRQISAPVEGVAFGESPNAHFNSHLRRLEVIVAPESGAVVQIRLRTDETNALPGAMPMNEAEECYRRTGEAFHELAAGGPTVPLQRLLDLAPPVAPAQIWDARQITAARLVNSRPGILEKAARWVVYFQGFPPMPAKGISDSTDAERSYLRLLFDERGEFLRGDNQPLGVVAP